jgi:hypothetical protein
MYIQIYIYIIINVIIIIIYIYEHIQLHLKGLYRSLYVAACYYPDTIEKGLFPGGSIHLFSKPPPLI